MLQQLQLHLPGWNGLPELAESLCQGIKRPRRMLRAISVNLQQRQNLHRLHSLLMLLICSLCPAFSSIFFFNLIVSNLNCYWPFWWINFSIYFLHWHKCHYLVPTNLQTHKNNFILNAFHSPLTNACTAGNCTAGWLFPFNLRGFGQFYTIKWHFFVRICFLINIRLHFAFVWQFWPCQWLHCCLLWS